MTKRILCQNCQRPEVACVCKFITPIANDIHVVVLQHPSEISQTKGTVTLLANSLHSCQIIVGENFTDNDDLSQVLSQYHGVLLYPSEHAQELSGSLKCFLQSNALQSHYERKYDSVDKNEPIAKPKRKMLNETSIEKTKSYCLIIIDGTWKKAYKMVMLSKTLQQLPQVCLPESLANAGQYHIRKVAKKNALSSLEACCYALSFFEGSDKYQKLLTKFNDFNQFQLSFRPKHHLSTDQINSLGKN